MNNDNKFKDNLSHAISHTHGYILYFMKPESIINLFLINKDCFLCSSNSNLLKNYGKTNFPKLVDLIQSNSFSWREIFVHQLQKSFSLNKREDIENICGGESNIEISVECRINGGPKFNLNFYKETFLSLKDMGTTEGSFLSHISLILFQSCKKPKPTWLRDEYDHKYCLVILDDIKNEEFDEGMDAYFIFNGKRWRYSIDIAFDLMMIDRMNQK